MRSQRTEKKTSDALALMNKLAGRDREMDAAKFLVRVLAEAGMVVEINSGRVHR